MKKITFFILTMTLLSAVTWQVQAQRPVGDTLMGPGMDTSYYPDVYDWLPTADSHEWYTYPVDLMLWQLGVVQGPPSSVCPVLGYELNGNIRHGNQFYTDRPLKILGIAACARAQNIFYCHFPDGPTDSTYIGIVDTTLAGRNTDSLLLYTFSSTGPKYLTGGPWRVEYPYRHMILPRREYRYAGELHYRGDRDSDWSWPTDTVNAALYEVIFNEPVAVRDSFIVAGTANNNETVGVFVPFPNGVGQNGITTCLFEHRPTRYWSVWAPFDNSEPQMVNWMKVRGGEWIRKNGEDWHTSGGWYYRYFNVNESGRSSFYR